MMKWGNCVIVKGWKGKNTSRMAKSCSILLLIQACLFVLSFSCGCGGCEGSFLDEDTFARPDVIDGDDGTDTEQDGEEDLPDDPGEDVATDRAQHCETVGCNGHGICDYDSGICSCSDGYAGDFCENCAPGYERNPGTGDCVSNIDCLDTGACSHHGTCRDDGGTRCECYQDRYNGAICSECEADYDWFSDVCALKVESRASQDRGYDWYKTQAGTGVHESNNCGPASAAMSIMWHEQSIDVDPGVVREAVTGGEGGWWNTVDIENALDNYGVPYAIMELGSIDALKTQIDAGHVLILCLTMGAVSRESPPYTSHFNRFYTYDSGHFIVVKGYMEEGGWLDIYDPNNWSVDYYTDGQPYGRDRFYNGSETVGSARSWWPYMFVIGASRSKGLNPRDIPIGRSGP